MGKNWYGMLVCMNDTRYTLEFVTWPGLLPALSDELDALGVSYQSASAQALHVRTARPWQLVPRIRCAQSVFVVLSFAVPRPKALLGQQYWDQIIAVARDVMQQDAFQSVAIDAAGAESAVMQRIVHTLASTLSLRVADADADLQVRIRRSAAGWDVLIRATPRPLGTRAWRVCNYPGAVNAVVAASMVRLAGIYADDRICNMACGSATLLIERLLYGPAAQAVGCDTDAAARACAIQNIGAAGLQQNIQITDWDATRMPIADHAIDLVLADFPFGQLIGTHNDNQTLYPALIREAARILSPRGRMVVISHEIRLLRQSVAALPSLHIGDEIQVEVGGMHPVMLLVQPSVR